MSKTKLVQALRFDEGKLDFLDIHPKVLESMVAGLIRTELPKNDLLNVMAFLEQMNRWFRHKEPVEDFYLLRALPFACPVLNYGRSKYANLNYAKGMKYTRVMNSFLRHVIKYCLNHSKVPRDQYIPGFDPKELEFKSDHFSGLPEIGHIACNLVFAATYDKILTEEQKKEFDDRDAFIL